jgi:hypothetical protein
MAMHAPSLIRKKSTGAGLPGRAGRKGARLLLALLFVIGVTVSVSVAAPRPAQALTTCATPAPFPVAIGSETSAEETYNFTPHATCSALALPGTNFCVVYDDGLGDGGDNTACEELYVNTNHDGNWIQIYAVGSFYCESASGALRSCGSMSVDSELAYKYQGGGSTYVTTGNPVYSCSGSGCPAGVATRASSHFQLSGTLYAVNDCVETWGEAPAGEKIGKVTTGGNVGTLRHVNICARDQIAAN